MKARWWERKVGPMFMFRATVSMSVVLPLFDPLTLDCRFKILLKKKINHEKFHLK